MKQSRSPFIYLLLFFISIASLKGQQINKLNNYRLQDNFPKECMKADEQDKTVQITTGNYILAIQKKGFRHAFRQPDGLIIASAHPKSGVQIGADTASFSDIRSSKLIKQEDNHLIFEAETESGI